MKKRFIIPVIVVLAFIVSGCENKLKNTGEFKAYGEGEYWEVTSYYKVSDNWFSEYAVLTFTGEGSVKDGEYKWNFPEKLGIGSSGSLPAKNIHQTPKGSSGIGEKRPVSFYQEQINQTSILIQWEDEYGNHKEQINLEINN